MIWSIHIISQTCWGQCYGMGMQGCQGNWETSVYWCCACRQKWQHEFWSIQSHTLLRFSRFTEQIANNQQHTAKANQEFLKTKKLDISKYTSQVRDLKATENAFELRKTKLNAQRPTNKQQLSVAALKSISREETGFQTPGNHWLQK